MPILIFIIGFLVLLVCIPMLFSYAIRLSRLRKKEGKDSPTVKLLGERASKISGIAIVALLTMVISTSFFPDSEPAGKTDDASVRQESERLAQSSSSKQSQNPAQPNLLVIDSKPSINELVSAPEPELRFIPGITSADVKLNLQKWGLEFGFDSGKSIDPDTGVELGTSLVGDLPMQISSVDFYVDGTAMIGTLSAESFLAVASGYLGYCATLPYEGADPIAAREWVKNNIASANRPGHPLETMFGPVRYTLYGGKYIRHLSIEAQ